MTRTELKTAIVRGIVDAGLVDCPDRARGLPCADCLTTAVAKHLPEGTVTG
jgi:hypothetical protein